VRHPGAGAPLAENVREMSLIVPVLRFSAGAGHAGARAGPVRMVITGTALMAFLLAACGGGGSRASVAHIGKSGPTTTVPTAAGSSSGAAPSVQQLYQDAVAYVGCMHSHGDPTFPPATMVDNATQQVVGLGNQPGDTKGRRYRTANKACDYLLPNSGAGPTQAQVQQALAKGLKFSECMRSHGIPNFPDPKENKQGISIGPAPGLAPNSPRFQAAQNDCRSFAPLGPRA
jgi:hypothetical protein